MMDNYINHILTHKDLLYSGVLADVLDQLGQRNCVLPSRIRPLDPDWTILGRAVPLWAVTVTRIPDTPYAVELECVDSLAPGDVLVAGTDGHDQSALWGELLSTAAMARGAVGAIIDGFARDSSRILAMAFPVFAAGCHPHDSKGRLAAIHYGRPIEIGSCPVCPGDIVLGDRDGIVVVPASLADQAFPLALAKVMGENQVRAELASGRSAQEVFAQYGIL
jgi:regulator of RNase E activity RraA